MQILLSLLALLPILLLMACSNVRDQMDLTRNAPDEFKVVKNVPLEIPTNLYALPVPQPGAPRPQERKVTRQVEQHLFGTQATNIVRPSRAEALLLQQAGADTSQSDIRDIINQDNSTPDLSKQPVAKRLLGIGSDGSEDEILDANAESQRLKENGN